MTSRRCRACNRESSLISSSLEVCLSCIRDNYAKSEPYIAEAHGRVRRTFGLPPTPPRTAGGVPCTLCANECVIGKGDRGYCGLRANSSGVFTSATSPNEAALYYYLDPQVTNCCAAWFCPAGTGAGYPKHACRPGPEIGYYNLALFFYGCNFDCLFCQNASHKELETAPRCNMETLVSKTLENKRISCWCFFGGSPEPQLPFAVSASRTMLDSKPEERVLRICFEWNGAGNRLLVDRAAELALRSGGNIKFDLKCGSDTVSRALSGVSNRRAFENFEMLFRKYDNERPGLPLLTATTLLVPGYVDDQEVEKIAIFLSDLDEEIPYSLLVFHPDFMMSDLPVTPYRQVEDCYRAAKKHLTRVNVGNLASLGLRSLIT
jgi:pyruvate formate lyase activating enzyme